MPAWLRALLLLSLLTPAQASAEIVRLDVERVQNRYVIAIEALLDAPDDFVRALMGRPENWPVLTRSIRASRVISSVDASHYRVETDFHHCVLFVCRTLRKVSDFAVDAAGDQSGTSVEGEGDFAYIRETWRVRAENGRTRLVFEAEMIPGFVVPPFIGARLVRSALRDMIGEIERSLVRLAKEIPVRE